MSSKYPNQLDVFTVKRNAEFEGDTNGDFIMAEDINALQDSVESIQSALGANPQGSDETVAKRLASLKEESLLRVPRFLIYLGDPSSVNGSSSLDRAVDYFSKYKHVVLGKSQTSEHNYIITEIKEVSSTRFYGYIDCGISSLNLTIEQIQSQAQAWVNAGAIGIYCDNFGYDSQVTRERQNQILDAIHEIDAVAILSAVNYLDVLGNAYHDTMNPDSIAPNVEPTDIYHYRNFAIDGGTKTDLSSLISTTTSLYNYDVKVFASTKIDNQDDFEYAHNLALLTSLEGFYGANLDYGESTNIAPLYTVNPILANWYTDTPYIKSTASGYERETPFGKIVTDSTGKTTFEGLSVSSKFVQIETGSIDGSALADLSVGKEKIKDYDIQKIVAALNMSNETIDADNLAGLDGGDITGSVPVEAIQTNVIEAINAYMGTATIGSAKIGELEADKITVGTLAAERIASSVVAALELYANTMSVGDATINTAVIGELQAENLQASVITAINASMEMATIDQAAIGELDAEKIAAGDISAERLRANVVNAVNMYTDTMTVGDAKIDSASIGQLTSDHITAEMIEADHIKVGSIDSTHIKTNSITSDNIQSNAITSDKIDAGSITSEHIGVSQIDAMHISAGTIRSQHIDSESIDTNHIKAGSIDATKIQADAITSDHITADAIDAGHIQASSISSGHIQASSISSDHIEAQAINADHITADSISADHIQSDTIGANHIKAGSITSDKIDAGAITAEHISVDVIDANHIKSGVIVSDHLGSDSVSAVHIASESISSGHIQAGAITADKIDVDTIDANHIKAGSIQSGHIQSDSIDAAHIQSNSIESSHIKTGSIISDHIDVDTVNATHIVAGSITSDKIDTGAITADKIDVGVVNASHIVSDSIESDHIVSGSITSDKIDTGAITADKIDVGVVNSSHIATNTINASHIQSNSISSSHIMASSITAGKIATEAVTSDKIEANAITAEKINANAITSEKIEAGAISADKIQSDAIEASHIQAGVINSAHIEAYTISSQHIQSEAIESTHIRSQSILSGHISSDSIESDHINTNIINARHIGTDVIEAHHVQAGAIESDHIKSDAIDTDHLRAGAITSDKIEAGAITVDLIKASVINAINASIEEAVIQNAQINQAAIEDLSAEKITSGHIETERMNANVVDAVNAYLGQAKIDSARIGTLSADHIQSVVISAINASFENATIDSAKIGELSADKITAGTIHADRIVASVVEAINTSVRESIEADVAKIDAAAIKELTADHIKGAVIEAINFSTEYAEIDSAKIGDIDAGKITSGTIDTNILKANILSAVNASLESVQIEEAKIADLSAEKITAGNISADRMQTNVIEAVNAYAQTITAESAKIESAAIGQLTADRIQAEVIKAVNLQAGSAVIDSAKIQSAAVGVLTTNNLQAGLIEASHISGDEATITRILAGEITGTDIQPLQIDAGHIKAGSISTDHISAEGIDAKIITTGYLDADVINVRSIQGTQLQFDAITGWEMSSDSVEARHIQADAVTGEVIRAGTITAEHISTGGLDATSMFVYGIDGETIIGGGYLRVDGMDVGVIQSDNLAQNGNFNIYSHNYGYLQNNVPGETIIGLETPELGSHEIWAYDMIGSSKQTMADTMGSWSISTDTLYSGHYRVAITVIDDLGSVVGADAFYFTVDTTQTLVEATNPDDHAVISDPTPTFSGTAGPSYTIDMGVYYIKRIPVDKKPTRLTQLYDGVNHYVYAATQGSNSVSVVDMSKHEMIASVDTGSQPGAVAVSNDGTKLFVANTDLGRMSDPDYLTIINTATLQVEKQVIVGTAPTNLYVSNVHPYVYIVASKDADVYIYDLEKEDIVGAIDVGEPLGKFSYGIDFNSDETIMYISNILEDKIIVVDMNTQSIITKISTGDAPSELRMHPDGSAIYVVTSGSNSIEVYETTYYTQVLSQKIGAKPMNLRIYPNPNKSGSYHLYVNCSGQNEVVILDMDTNQLVGILETGQNPFGILMSAKQNEFLVANSGNNSFISFVYPEGPFIGDAYLDEKAEEGQTTYNGAAGWAPKRQSRAYDPNGNLIGASSIEFHIDETFQNQTGYAKLYSFGMGNQYSEMQQDTDLVENYSNGLPLQKTGDLCVLTSHLVYKSSKREWVVNQAEEVYYLDPNYDTSGYPIFTSTTTWDADVAKTQVANTDYNLDHSKGEITFIESTFPGYYGIFDGLFPESEYTIGDYYKKITFLTSAYLTKFTDMLTHYAVDTTTYTVDSVALTVTFDIESDLLQAFKVSWPQIEASYLHHENVWFNDYNASALVSWERPAPQQQHIGMYVEEFVPKFVVFENGQLTPFTPTDDNINEEYQGLTYSGIKNVALNSPQEKIMVTDTNSSVSLTYNYGMNNAQDLSRIVDGKTDDSTKYLQTGDGISTITVDLSDDANGKSAYITNGIRVLHYYAENWKYTTNIIEVSHDGATWVTLYDASVHGAYMETADGIAVIYDSEAQGPYSRIDTGQIVVPIPNQLMVRFLRNTIGGATAADDTALASPQNRWVEIENYADWWVTTEYKYQVSQLGTDAGARLGVSGKSATGDGTNYPSIVGDLLDDTQLDFLTEQIHDLRMFVLNGGKAFRFDLPIVQEKDYSSASTNNYDVLANDLTTNINAIIDNYNTINQKAIPFINVSHSNGMLVFTSLDASTTNTIEVFVEIPMTLSGTVAKTNVSNAYVEADIELEYTSEWHATFLKGQEMGIGTVLVDEEIDGDMPEDWFPPYLIMSEMVTRNGSYTGDKLNPGRHRVRFQQSSGTVAFDRFRFDDFQVNGRQFLNISTSGPENSWKRYKLNPRKSINYVGKGRQTTYGPFDSPRTSPITRLGDGSCQLKYRIVFRSEIEDTGSMVEGTTYVTGVVLERGKLSTHWRPSESSDAVTTDDIQWWEITRPETTGIQTYHLANGVVTKEKLRTHIVEDFHISPFASIPEYKLKLNHDTHPHTNKGTLDTITGWGTDGTSTDMARADHEHPQYVEMDVSGVVQHSFTLGKNVSVLDGITIDGVDVGTLGSNFSDHAGDSNIHFTVDERTKLSGISSGATKVEVSTNNGKIKIDDVEKTVYAHPISDGNLHVPAVDTSGGNLNQVLKAGSAAKAFSWGTVDWSEIGNAPTSTVTNIDGAVTDSHSQNTDTGTTSSVFNIRSDVASTNPAGIKFGSAAKYPYIRWSGTALEVYQAFDTATEPTHVWSEVKALTFKKSDGTEVSYSGHGHTWSDITVPDGTTFDPPIATSTVLGGVMEGANISIATDGTISGNYSLATQTDDGLFSSGDKIKLDGIDDSANNYTHPASHSLSMIDETTDLKVMTATERTKLSNIAENANNYSHPASHSLSMITETATLKVMTSDERTKLAGIEESAINQTSADGRYLQLTGGTLSSGLTINNAGDATLTLNADTDNDAAEGGEPKLVLTQDASIIGAEIKLSQGGTTNNTLVLAPFTNYDTATPTKNYSVFIHDKKIWHEGNLSKSEFTPASHVGTSGTSHAAVTDTENGFMTTTLKQKLDGVSEGATKVESSATNGDIKIDNVGVTVYIHPNENHIPSGGASSNFLKWSATGTAQWSDIAWADVVVPDGTTFTPASHKHPVSEISDITTYYYTKTQVDTEISNAGNVRTDTANTMTEMNTFTNAGLAVKLQPSAAVAANTVLFQINNSTGNALVKMGAGSTDESTGKVVINGDLEVTGSTVQKSTQDISGDMNITGNINVTGDAILGDAATDQTTVKGDLRLEGDFKPVGRSLEVTRFPVYGIGGDLQFQTDSTTFEQIIEHYSTFNSTVAGAVIPPVSTGAERRYKVMIAYSTVGDVSDAQFRIMQSDGATPVIEFTLPQVWGSSQGIVRHWMSTEFTTAYAGHTKFEAASAGTGKDLVIKYIEVIAYDYYS